MGSAWNGDDVRRRLTADRSPTRASSFNNIVREGSRRKLALCTAPMWSFTAYSLQDTIPTRAMRALSVVALVSSTCQSR
jgi:hypothetical protein